MTVNLTSIVRATVRDAVTPDPQAWRPRRNDPGWFRRIPVRSWVALAVVFAALLFWLLGGAR